MTHPRQSGTFKGSDAGYRAAHWRIHTDRGKASEYSCVECGEAAQQWAYNHSDPNEKSELVNGSLCRFSLNTDNYDPMCRVCHKARDSAARN